MAKTMKKTDIELLKAYFIGKSYKEEIEELSDTSPEILRLFKNQYSNTKRFFSSFSLAIIVFVLTYAVSLITGDFFKELISFEFPFGAIIACFFVLGFILFFYVIARSLRNQMIFFDKLPILYEFMAILIEDSDNADGVRQLLEKKANKKRS